MMDCLSILSLCVITDSIFRLNALLLQIVALVLKQYLDKLTVFSCVSLQAQRADCLTPEIRHTTSPLFVIVYL